ncbi:dehydratase [Mycolicibacterium phlei]|uniref:MaoC/PaaZ C-terminal domain-containing protein n=1 Tax=Mycobacteroides chelonae TaxID=1774 RepID=UPI000618CD9C|nr:MaoC/PaaZ C-terminal domain-containing protein [Mycobacteroides chelonae]VEG20540.1 dehydratase [Mycolicibacterium phlei]AKC40851.1 dehydratase [Mycobacteroides chelonae]ANB00584.1 dehydratase [Mycobacteroides chelonae CCUG 47445]OLT81707.1 dehydratase [Mycobacteroides chelonae]ORV14474.1 dehydratase [Mycobacteroides chelonae]
MPDDLVFDDSGLNQWTDEERFEVTGDRLAEYAAATNDPIREHLRGDIAPPVFAIVPVFEAMLMPAVDVLPVELIPRVVHGEQDFRFHRPIRPGDKLISRGKMIGYEGLENGTRAAIKLECRDESGELVNEQYVTTFVRGFNAGKKVGELSPEHKFVDALRNESPAAKVVQQVDLDQTFRYSAASGDPMPIHLDEEVARDAGLPGIIAHGLCTMAFTSWALLTELAGSDTARLGRLAVRFSKMVLPGDSLETRIWKKGSANGFTTYAFETARGDDFVITDGLAEIAD